MLFDCAADVAHQEQASQIIWYVILPMEGFL
jgi:hypothetical protein